MLALYVAIYGANPSTGTRAEILDMQYTSSGLTSEKSEQIPKLEEDPSKIPPPPSGSNQQSSQPTHTP